MAGCSRTGQATEVSDSLPGERKKDDGENRSGTAGADGLRRMEEEGASSEGEGVVSRPADGAAEAMANHPVLGTDSRPTRSASRERREKLLGRITWRYFLIIFLCQRKECVDSVDRTGKDGCRAEALLGDAYVSDGCTHVVALGGRPLGGYLWVLGLGGRACLTSDQYFLSQ